jgi:hypothetical protein
MASGSSKAPFLHLRPPGDEDSADRRDQQDSKFMMTRVLIRLTLADMTVDELEIKARFPEPSISDLLVGWGIPYSCRARSGPRALQKIDCQRFAVSFTAWAHAVSVTRLICDLD